MDIQDFRSDPRARIRRLDVGDGPIDAVREIIAEVKAHGDAALFELTERFDGVKLDTLSVESGEIDSAFEGAAPETIAAFETAAERIEEFARHQVIRPWTASIGGATLGEIVTAVPRAGLYVPGGKAVYPSSVLMSALPAKVAGVEQIVLCVPPASDGSVPVATLVAAKVAGVHRIFKVGGAQAIAAMAYGTESVPKVDVIAGPGNIYVALAKAQVSGFVGIDSIAGPSEIAIVADDTAAPNIVAIDLVAQAEHGPDGTFAVITWSPELAAAMPDAIDAALDEVGASDALRAAIEAGTNIVLVDDVEQAAVLVDDLGPEHLELIFEGADARMFGRAGAIFVGPYSPVPLGDYLAGSNHVLPTAGAARWASGLRTSHFQKATAVVEHSESSLSGSVPFIETFAALEGLPIHARAVQARFRDADETPERSMREDVGDE